MSDKRLMKTIHKLDKETLAVLLIAILNEFPTIKFELINILDEMVFGAKNDTRT